MLQPEKRWSKHGVDHPRSKKCRNIWQGQCKMRGVISVRFKNTLLFGAQCLNSQCRKVSTLEKKRAAGSTREALLSEAGFEKVSGPRIGSVGGSCFR